ncbi:Glutamate semialdehyde dehydrogenase, partial [Operophtera brumata]
VLVTKPDFYNEETRKNLFCTLSELISLNIVPIVNTNDAVSPPMYIHDDTMVPGTGKKSDLLIMMSDVDGIYNKPPWEDGARMMHTYTSQDKDMVQFGKKSKTIINGRKVARSGSRTLQKLTPSERASAIHSLADLLLNKQDKILEANTKDLEEATKNGVAKPLLDRLSLSQGKLKTLSIGLKQIADSSYENVGRVLTKTKLAENLVLQQVTVPIGVLLVIFESRPDSLPQVAALAMASANGLLLKGGKEAAYSNKALMDLVKESLGTVGAEDAISLVSTREEISDLLAMEKHIDLIIPRGSSDLVRSIQKQSQHIPVLGHAEGICHVFIDKDADPAKALKIVRDAKCDYPAACNAMETLLIHEDHISGSLFTDICTMLKNEGVIIHAGPKLSSNLTFGPPPAKTMRHEYGSLECCIEVVKDFDEATTQQNNSCTPLTAPAFSTTYRRDSLTASDLDSALKSAFLRLGSTLEYFPQSLQFADDLQLAQGAEAGISTPSIHANMFIKLYICSQRVCLPQSSHMLMASDLDLR